MSRAAGGATPGTGQEVSSTTPSTGEGTATGAAAAGSTETGSMVMRGGQMKKAFAPKIPGSRRKPKTPTPQTASPAEPSTSKGTRKGKERMGAGGKGSGSGKGARSWNQAQGLFSEGFGSDPVPKSRKAGGARALTSRDRRTDAVVVKEEVVDVGGEAPTASIRKRRASRASTGAGTATRASSASAAPTKLEDGTVVSDSDDDGAGSDVDAATLFPHTAADSVPVRLPLGKPTAAPLPPPPPAAPTTTDAHEDGPSYRDVSDFPQPDPGTASYIFVQLPSLQPDITAARQQDEAAAAEQSIPMQTVLPDSAPDEVEVVDLAAALHGTGDGQIGTLRIRASGRAELIMGGDVYTFQKGTAVDCLQQVAAVDAVNGKMVTLGSVPPTQRYIALRDLSKAEGGNTPAGWS
eukprot:m.216092 g.216092  ORF g.216092 m.216092 type:complete len:407 (+) comp28164_c0_seq1:157-1377(+)